MLDPAEASGEETAVDRVASLLADVAGGERAEVNVYRIESDGMEFCCKFLPDEFEQGGLDLIRRRFGAGEFEIRLYGTKPGSNRFAVRGKTRIKIAQDRGAPDAPVAGAGPGGDAVARALESIAAGQMRLAEMLADRQQSDPMESVERTLALMGMMRAAMGDRQQSPVSEVLATMRELRTAAQELNPPADGDGGGDRTMKIFGSIAEMVSAAMQARAAQPVAAAAPPVAMRTAQPVAALPAAPPPEPGEPREVIELRAHLAALVRLASVKKPATTVEAGAELVYEVCPDEVVAFLRGGEWFELLKGLAPDVESHREWFDKVRVKALALIDADAAQESSQTAK